MLIIKLRYTEVKFQTGLSSLRASCKRALKARLHETGSELKQV